jgi:hypothetical protein
LSILDFAPAPSVKRALIVHRLPWEGHAGEVVREFASTGQEGLALLKEATAALSALLDRSKLSFVENDSRL